MKCILTIIFLVISFKYGLTQERNRHIPKYDNGQVNFWYEYDSLLFNKIGLSDLAKTPYLYHFRLRLTQQAIEVWKTNKGNTGGRIVSWTKENVPGNELPTNRFYHSEVQLDSLVVRDLLTIIDSSDIEEMNDDGRLAGLGGETEPVSYIIEYADSTDCFFKVHTPILKESRNDIIRIQQFVMLVYNFANLSKAWVKFAPNIPFESYYNCCPRITSTRNNLTKKQRNKFKKERNAWRKKQS